MNYQRYDVCRNKYSTNVTFSEPHSLHITKLRLYSLLHAFVNFSVIYSSFSQIHVHSTIKVHVSVMK